MHKKQYLIMLSGILTITIQMRGQIGCMDNTNRLEKTDYHYVACTCPCERYSQRADRNKCSKCNHCHDIQRYIIISNKNKRTK